MKTASSPCIQHCVIDQATQLCEGCGRTLNEIGRWSVMSERERLTVMAGLPQRLATQSASNAKNQADQKAR